MWSNEDDLVRQRIDSLGLELVPKLQLLTRIDCNDIVGSAILETKAGCTVWSFVCKRVSGCYSDIEVNRIVVDVGTFDHIGRCWGRRGDQLRFDRYVSARNHVGSSTDIRINRWIDGRLRSGDANLQHSAS